MSVLSRSQLASGAVNVAHTPGAPLPPVTVLQFGEGNFLRAFVDWMIDVANERGVANNGVAIAQPLPMGKAQVLRDQDCLYTVLLRGIENGKTVSDRRVVSCVVDAFDPYANWGLLIGYATSPDLRFLVSNTTEAGIADVEEPFEPGVCPKSFPAKVAALLLARYRAFAGAPDRGLIAIPCELIEHNGSELKRIVLLHAKRWGVEPGFAEWVDKHNHFLDTLVDRIVPGYPANEVDGLFAEWGYTDPQMVAAEPFHVWVIQGPAELEAEFPLKKAGLNVVWTSDLKPYRTRKVRILNGAHTGCALASILAGLDTVGQMMDDPSVSAFLRRLMFEAVVPYIRQPEDERQAYAASIVERFANPSIRHELMSISLNSVSKWSVRVLPTVKDWAADGKAIPETLSFSLAALLRFYKIKPVDGAYVGDRGISTYTVRDDQAVLETMAAVWAAKGSDPAAVAKTLLADARLWGQDLTALPGFANAVAAHLAKIEAVGMKAAIAAFAK